MFILTSSIQAQTTVSGTLKDGQDSSKIAGATIKLQRQKDSIVIVSTVSNAAGTFSIKNLFPDSVFITISSPVFDNYVSYFNVNNADKNLGTITLDRKTTNLTDVTVVSKAPNVLQKGDTTQFSASSFKVNPDATIEDLIKKMPGITVAKDGTVTAQGETVKKVTIDGKDFFGDDASAALKNLPSQAVDKIQLYDRQSDQAKLTGFDDGNTTKAINVVTKAGLKNGQFGRIYAGAGTDNRYSAGGNVSLFKGDRRVSFIGNFNNINQQNFGSQDLLGLSSSGGRGGGGGHGGGRGGGGSDFQVNTTNGISKTNALGVNYGDKWGKKINVSGSYFFNNSNNINQSTVNTQTFTSPKNQFSIKNGYGRTENTNNRVNARIEYTIDSNNTLYIIPSLSFQKNNSSQYSNLRTFYGANDSLNTYTGNNIANRDGYNLGNNLLYRHSFAKKGRSVTFGLNTSLTKNNGEYFTTGRYRFFNNGGATDSLQNQYNNNLSNGNNVEVNIDYTEPLGKNSQLQLTYNPSVQNNKADQQTFNYDGSKYSKFDSTLSNRFNNKITTQSGGLSYRISKDKSFFFTAGVNLQNTNLQSDRVFPTQTSVNQSFSNLLPYLFYRGKFGNYSNLRVFYRSYTNFPSINQLQDVVNLNDPLRVTTGNPALKQANGNYLGSRYSYTNSKTNKSFFVNLFYQNAQDYITNATYIASADSVIQQGNVLRKGSQLNKPVNLNGYQNIRTNINYSMPLKFIKTNLNLSTGFGYAKLPGLINNRATLTENYTYSGGVVLASNINQYVDFNVNYNYNGNKAKTSGSTLSNNNYVNQSAGVTLNLLDKKGWFVQNDVSNQSYSGLSSGLNQSFWLWNAAIGKKFLKNQAGELKLSVFDLLKQNQSINRAVTSTYIEDSQTNVLQQYFLATFTYNLKNFGTPPKNNFKEEKGHF